MMTEERWKDVPGYEGVYEVSDAGRVRRIGISSGAMVGRILKATRTTNGYLQVCLQRRGARKFYVHRLVLSAFIGVQNAPCNHKNGNKRDNHLTNLEYSTPSANNMHARRILKRNIGSEHPLAKLTTHDVQVVRKMIAGGCTHDDIATRFRVSRSTISMIANGTNWAHLHS